MNRLLTVAFIALTALVSVYMYFLAEEVRGLEGDLAQLNSTLIEERENINVLEAEWAFVARPEVLQDKAQRHLALAPVRADQIISFNQLPRREDRLAAPQLGVSAETPESGGKTQPELKPSDPHSSDQQPKAAVLVAGTRP
jgi:hypothetical protein